MLSPRRGRDDHVVAQRQLGAVVILVAGEAGAEAPAEDVDHHRARAGRRRGGAPEVQVEAVLGRGRALGPRRARVAQRILDARGPRPARVEGAAGPRDVAHLRAREAPRPEGRQRVGDAAEALHAWGRVGADRPAQRRLNLRLGRGAA